jgi:hypothetical protein
VRALELPEETKATLRELRALSDQAKDGDKEARRELRRVLRASSPEIVIRASDLARWGQQVLITTAAGKDPLMEEALTARLDLMRVDIAGQEASPLELLLAERIVSCWLLVETLDALLSIQLGPHLRPEQRSPMSYLRHVFKWQESANRRYLSAIRELARVRKLQNNAPGVQINTQINLASTGGGD